MLEILETEIYVVKWVTAEGKVTDLNMPLLWSYENEEEDDRELIAGDLETVFVNRTGTDYRYNPGELGSLKFTYHLVCLHLLLIE